MDRFGAIAIMIVAISSCLHGINSCTHGFVLRELEEKVRVLEELQIEQERQL